MSERFPFSSSYQLTLHLPYPVLLFFVPYLPFLLAASYCATPASICLPAAYFAARFLRASYIAFCFSSSVNSSFFSSYAALACSAFLAFCFSFFFRFYSRFFSSISVCVSGLDSPLFSLTSSFLSSTPISFIRASNSSSFFFFCSFLLNYLTGSASIEMNKN